MSRESRVWAWELTTFFAEDFGYRLNREASSDACQILTHYSSTFANHPIKIISEPEELTKINSDNRDFITIYVNETQPDSLPEGVVYMKEGVISDPSLADTYRGITEVLTPVPTVAEVRTWQKRVNERQRKRKVKTGLPAYLQFKYVIPGICIILFIIATILTPKVGFDSIAGLLIGADYPDLIYGNYEWWRLITCNLAHVNLMHIAMNLLAWFNVIDLMIVLYPGRQLLFLALISALGSSALVLVANDVAVITLGLSGVLFGFMGALLVFVIEGGSSINPAFRASLFRTLMINAFISFLPKISMLGHLGGFVGGVVGAVSIRILTTQPKQRLVGLALVFLLFFGYGVIGNVKGKPASNPYVDAYYVQSLRLLGLDWYAEITAKNLYNYLNYNP